MGPPGTKHTVKAVYVACARLEKMPYSVFHIEDDPLWKTAISTAVQEWVDFVYVGSENSGQGGIDRCKSLRPEILLLDLRLPDMSGFKVFSDLKSSSTPPSIIFLTARADEFTLISVHADPTIGMVWKSIDYKSHLRSALYSASNGTRNLAPKLMSSIRMARSHPNAFHKIISDREQSIIRYLAEGHTDEEVAAIVGIRASTARTHRENIMRKLNLHRTQDLIKWAQEKGFYTPLLSGPPTDGCSDWT